MTEINVSFFCEKNILSHNSTAAVCGDLNAKIFTGFRNKNSIRFEMEKITILRKNNDFFQT